MEHDGDRLTPKQRRALDRELARRKGSPPDGWYWLVVVIFAMIGIFAMLYVVVGATGCIKSGDKQIQSSGSGKVENTEALVTIEMFEDFKAQTLAEVNATINAKIQAQVAAQINQIGGNQIQNSTWAMIALIIWPGLLQLADKIGRRFKTVRRIDAAVKGQKPVTVSE